MNIFRISVKNICNQPLSSILNVILFATGVFIISFLLLLKDQFQHQLEKNVAGIDLVVGAKGSPLQLILSSIYHVDYPTGNIFLSEAEKLEKNPLVKKTIPIALGDSYRGFRIVGTNTEYPSIYQAKLKDGALWQKDLEVTIGSKVAESGPFKIGDQFAGVHGFMEEAGHSHDDFKYTVTGIFEPTGSVLDQLILTNISSVWAVHSHHDHHDEEDHTHSEECDHHEEDALHHHDHEEECDSHDHDHEHMSHEEVQEQKEITSLLVFYRNPMGAVSLPRHINKNTNMQAASPAMEINRLYSLMGPGMQSVNMIAYVIIIISGFSIFISLLNSMKSRRYELALIRVMGGGKMKVFFLVLFEGLIITIIGFIIGFVLSRMGMFVISMYTEDNFHYTFRILDGLKNDFILLGVSLLIGFIVSIIPAVKAMNTDISRTLSK